MKMIKEKAGRTLLFILLALTISFLPISVEASAVKLANTSMEVRVGEYVKVKVKNLKQGSKVKYKSSDGKIAKVSQKGTVRGVSEGEATITVTITTDGEKTSLTCSIKTLPPEDVECFDIHNYVNCGKVVEGPYDGSSDEADFGLDTVKEVYRDDNVVVFEGDYYYMDDMYHHKLVVAEKEPLPNYIKKYFNIISEQKSESKARFCLTYIDNDDIPELLIFSYPSDYDVGSGAYIYYYKNGKVKTCEDSMYILGKKVYMTGNPAFGNYGHFTFAKKRGYILDTFSSYDGSSTYWTYYRFNNGKFELLDELTDGGDGWYFMGSGVPYFHYTDSGPEPVFIPVTRITREKYLKKQKKYEKYDWTDIYYKDDTFYCKTADPYDYKSYIK